MKLTLIDWGALTALIVLLLIFPVTNGLIAMAIDLALSQVALVGSGFVQVPATLLIVYIVWRVTQFTSRQDKVKIPKKSAKTNMQKYLEL